MGQRDLANTCVGFLSCVAAANDIAHDKYKKIALNQFNTATNMTDELEAMAVLIENMQSRI